MIVLRDGGSCCVMVAQCVRYAPSPMRALLYADVARFYPAVQRRPRALERPDVRDRARLAFGRTIVSEAEAPNNAMLVSLVLSGFAVVRRGDATPEPFALALDVEVILTPPCIFH
jgi:hypothetical protein